MSEFYQPEPAFGDLVEIAREPPGIYISCGEFTTMNGDTILTHKILCSYGYTQVFWVNLLQRRNTNRSKENEQSR